MNFLDYLRYEFSIRYPDFINYKHSYFLMQMNVNSVDFHLFIHPKQQFVLDSYHFSIVLDSFAKFMALDMTKEKNKLLASKIVDKSIFSDNESIFFEDLEQIYFNSNDAIDLQTEIENNNYYEDVSDLHF